MPRTWTLEQRLERAANVKAYWQEHPHPSRGRKHLPETVEKMRKPKQRSAIRNHCYICGRALYSAESARRGLGPTCAGIH